MKNLLTILLFITFQNFYAQKLEFSTLLEDKISIRAIEIWDGKVWYAGTMSKFGYVKIKNPKIKSQVQLNKMNQEFRVIARFKENFFETVNIGSPAMFYGVSPYLKVSEHNKVSDSTVFFDSFKVDAENNNGIMLSDPKSDGSPRFYLTSKQRFFKSSKINLPKYEKGEAHFAASNSNVALYKNFVWIASGGTKSRVFRFTWDAPNDWQVFETPFIQGSSSQGIYSIDFYNEKFGIAAGGDYTKQSENINNIATTNDGGETWQIQASGKNAGYMTCVKIRPSSKGKEIIAVGDQHISYSADFGKTWIKISDEKGLYTVEWVNKNTLVFAGKNRILKANFRVL